MWVWEMYRLRARSSPVLIEFYRMAIVNDSMEKCIKRDFDKIDEWMCSIGFLHEWKHQRVNMGIDKENSNE